MHRNLIWKVGLILLVVGAALYYSYPLNEKINLGLDLQGGMHLVLAVDVEKAVENEIMRIRSDLERQLLKEHRKPSSIEIGTGHLDLVYPDSDRRSAALDFIRDDFAYMEPEPVGSVDAPTIRLTLQADRIKEIQERAFEQALETIRNRVDEFGVSEPTIQRQQGMGGDRIMIQLPGIEDIGRAKEIIGKTAMLEFRLVKEGPAPKDEILRLHNGTLPLRTELLPSKTLDDQGRRLYYLLESRASVTGADLETARVGRDEYNQPDVNFVMNRAGKRKFADLTGRHVGDYLAIVLDGKVQSAPVIKSRITGNGSISGNFSVQEAQDLALVLRAGALPAPVKYLFEQSVGPSMGQDSVDQGIRAMLIGAIAVLLFMILYYKVTGLIADIILALNIVLILGALSGLHATLTLPGIAGLILTIGMAVDANVLIFERIREELDAGKTVRNAVSAGFSRAFLTILDANLTTLIAAFVLGNFGTGPIRGFAVTLGLGIAASMFTALFVGRVIFDIMLARRSVRTLSI